MSINAQQLEINYDYAKNCVIVRSSKPIPTLGIPVLQPSAEVKAGNIHYEYLIKFKPSGAYFGKVEKIVGFTADIKIPDLTAKVLSSAELGQPIKATFMESAEVTMNLNSVNFDVPEIAQQKLEPKPVSVTFDKFSLELNLNVNSEMNLEALRGFTLLLKQPTASFEEPAHYSVDFESILKGIPLNVTLAVKSSTAVLSKNEGTEDQKEIEYLEELYNKRFLEGLGTVFPDRPLIILAKKSGEFEYIEFLKRVLREIYRVSVGGLPEPKHVSVYRDLIQLIPFEVDANGKIFVIDLTQRLGKSEKLSYEAKEELVDRLRELFSQGFGFFVFYADDEGAEQVKDLWERIMEGDNIKYSPLKFQAPIVFKVDEPDLYLAMSNFMWGKVEATNSKIYAPIKSFDKHIVLLEEEYWNKLEEPLKNFNIMVKVKPNSTPDEKDRESAAHYLTKALTVKYLIREIEEELVKNGVPQEEAMMIANDCVETESEHFIEGNNTEDKTMRFDVYVSSKCNSSFSNLIVEIETLYSTGTVVHKLLEMINSRLKYSNKLWVVIPNPEAIIYLPLILKLRSHVRKLHPESEVEFYTLNTENGSLITLVSVMKKMIELLKIRENEEQTK